MCYDLINKSAELTAQETGDGRQDMRGRRWETGDRRLETADRTHEAGDSSLNVRVFSWSAKFFI